MGVLLIAVGATPLGESKLLHGRGCEPAACALEQPTSDELRAILGEANRLLTRYAHDSSANGRKCHQLGAAMRSQVGEVRMLPVMWRAVHPEGHLAAVTGDAHRTEPAEGAGRVHIARGFDALNPDRGLAAIVETARHEFAHLNGLAQGDSWGFDAGAQFAMTCGAPLESRPAAAELVR